MIIRGGSRTAATFKMEHFVIIVNGWKPLTIITKCSILDVRAVLDPHLGVISGTFSVECWARSQTLVINTPLILVLIRAGIVDKRKTTFLLSVVLRWSFYNTNTKSISPFVDIFTSSCSGENAANVKLPCSNQKQNWKQKK